MMSIILKRNRSHKSSEKRKKYFIFVIPLLLCSIFCFAPYFSQTSGIIPLLSILVVIMMILVSDHTVFQNRILVPILIFSSIDVFYMLIGMSFGFGNSLARMTFFLVIFIGLFFSNKVYKSLSVVVFHMVSFIVLVNILDNIRLCIMYPGASSDVIRTASLLNTNVGGTYFSVVSLLFYNICFFVALNIKNTALRVCYIGGAVAAVIYILFFGMRGSVAVFLLISTFGALYFKFSQMGTFFKISAVVVFLMILISILTNENLFFDFLYSVVPEGRMVRRIQDLQQVSQSGFEDDSLSGRWGLYKVSINTWTDSFTNFVFGIGEDHRIARSLGYENALVGGHSEMLDLLPRWGVVGFALVTTILVRAYRLIINFFADNKIRKQAAIVYFSFILCCMFKAVFFSSIAFLVFFMLPLSSVIINNQNKGLK